MNGWGTLLDIDDHESLYIARNGRAMLVDRITGEAPRRKTKKGLDSKKLPKHPNEPDVKVSLNEMKTAASIFTAAKADMARSEKEFQKKLADFYATQRWRQSMADQKAALLKEEVEKLKAEAAEREETIAVLKQETGNATNARVRVGRAVKKR